MLLGKITMKLRTAGSSTPLSHKFGTLFLVASHFLTFSLPVVADTLYTKSQAFPWILWHTFSRCSGEIHHFMKTQGISS